MADEYLRIIDLSNKSFDTDELLRPTGVLEGELNRFLTTWAGCLCSVPSHQRPRACLFFLQPASEPITYVPSIIAAMAANISAQQPNGNCCVYKIDGSLVASTPIPQGTLKTLTAGAWTKEDAIRASISSKDSCVCLAVGLAFYVYVNGFPVLGYSDVLGRTFEVAADLVRHQAWGDGELLRKCGEEDLTTKGPLGIWHAVDFNILKYQPELAIQERLNLYLKAYLNGYEDVTREHHVENEGRVDFKIVTGNRLVYYVEIKWVGKSIKAAHVGKKIDWKKKKNSTKIVTILDENNGFSGVGQLEHYMSKGGANKGYLVIYDCREAGEAKGDEIVCNYPKARSLRSDQYRIFHVPVDPRSASVKAGGK